MNTVTKNLIELGQFAPTNFQKINLEELQGAITGNVLDIDLEDSYAAIAKAEWQTGGSANLSFHAIKNNIANRINVFGTGSYNDHKNQTRQHIENTASLCGLKNGVDYLIQDLKSFDRKAWLKQPIPLTLLFTYKDYMQVQGFKRHFNRTSKYDYCTLWDETHLIYANIDPMIDQAYDGKIGDFHTLADDIFLNDDIHHKQRLCMSTTLLHSHFRNVDFNYYFLEPGENFVGVNDAIWTCEDSLADIGFGKFSSKYKNWLSEIPDYYEEFNIVLINPGSFVTDLNKVKTDDKPGLLQCAQAHQKFYEDELKRFGCLFATYTGDGLSLIGQSQAISDTINGQATSLSERLDILNTKYNCNRTLFIFADPMVSCGLNISSSCKKRRLHAQVVDRNNKEEANLHRYRAGLYTDGFRPKIYSSYSFQQAARDYVYAQHEQFRLMKEEGLNFFEAGQQVAMSPDWFKPKIRSNAKTVPAGRHARPDDIEITGLVPEEKIDALLWKAMEKYCLFEGNKNKCPYELKDLTPYIPTGYKPTTKIKKYVEDEIHNVIKTNKYLPETEDIRLRGVFDKNYEGRYIKRNFVKDGLDGKNEDVGYRTVHFWYNSVLDKPFIRFMKVFNFDPECKDYVQHNFNGDLENFCAGKTNFKLAS